MSKRPYQRRAAGVGVRLVPASVLLLFGALRTAPAANWIAVDIDRMGAPALAALKADQRANHWIELGDRLLLRADSGLTKELGAAGRIEADLGPGELRIEPMVHGHHTSGSAAVAAGWRQVAANEKSVNSLQPRHGDVLAYQPGNRFDVGKAVPAAAMQDLLADVDPQRWQAATRTLAGHDRLSASGFNAAAEWVAGQFAEFGLEAALVSFDVPGELLAHASGGRNRNVVALQHGTGEDWLVLGAHLDSRNERLDEARPSPGAEDNASGCAAVLEAARILSLHRFGANIAYVCFGLEERGLLGSQAHARSLDPQRVKAMINLDMIAYTDDRRLDFSIAGTSLSAHLAEQLADVAQLYTDLEPVVSLRTCCSDHASYLARGIPAVMLISRDFPGYDDYHSENDRPDRLSTEQAGEVVKLVVAATADLAGEAARDDLNGYWFDPAQSGQGLHLEVQVDGRLLVAWYTFDGSGRPLWMVAQGAFVGRRAVLQAQTVSGGGFPAVVAPTAAQVREWGELQIEFADCQRAELRWQALDAVAFPDGRMPLRRLSTPVAGRCRASAEP